MTSDNADRRRSTPGPPRQVPLTPPTELVLRDGAGRWPTAVDDVPSWLKVSMADQELAGRLGACCALRDECLELDLRTAGPATVGVWGGLTTVLLAQPVRWTVRHMFWAPALMASRILE
jgi:hypothetical protein